jgi:hypothetical protein
MMILRATSIWEDKNIVTSITLKNWILSVSNEMEIEYLFHDQNLK